MSERFPARKGISASLRERLGDLGTKQTIGSWKQGYSRPLKEADKNREKNASKRSFSGSKGYDSGDSLEMDQGDDLRGELDGQHAANMVIQVLIYFNQHGFGGGDFSTSNLK